MEGTKLRGKFWMTGGSPDVSSPEQYWAQEKDALADLDKSRAEIASLEAQLRACAGEAIPSSRNRATTPQACRKS